MLAYVTLMRPFTLVPPMIGMATGAAAAVGATDRTLTSERIVTIALGMLMAATLNAASNAFNQVCDLEQDRINKPDRPVPSGAISPRAANVFAAVLFVLANVLAYFIDVGAGRECFVIVLFTTFLTWAYSGPPLRWRRFGWRANLTVAVPRGMLLKVAGWSCVAPVFSDVEPWYLGSVFFLFLLGATTTKDFADVAGDAAAGVRNLPVRLGPARATRLIAPFFVVPWLMLPLGAWLPGPILSPPAGVLAVLGLALALYGAYVVKRLLDDADAVLGENHPAWTHMYLLMMCAQLGSAAVYLV